MAKPLHLDWLIRRQVALGPAPTHDDHLQSLEQHGIKGVLCLCAIHEAPPPPTFLQRFRVARTVLSDHRSANVSSLDDLLQALAQLDRLLSEAAPVYVHCVASVERSPLVCAAWLMQARGLSRLQALDYVMAVHPISSPIPSQLDWLNKLERLR